MVQDYFVYNGVQYNTGDIVTISFFDYRIKNVSNVNATFLYYDTEKKEYCVEVYGQKYTYKEELFNKILYMPQINTDSVEQEYTFVNELNIEGMIDAWFWYIVVMLISIFFKDAIGIWALVSIIFFSYRNKKLKEAGRK